MYSNKGFFETHSQSHQLVKLIVSFRLCTVRSSSFSLILIENFVFFLFWAIFVFWHLSRHNNVTHPSLRTLPFGVSPIAPIVNVVSAGLKRRQTELSRIWINANFVIIESVKFLIIYKFAWVYNGEWVFGQTEECLFPLKIDELTKYSSSPK